ncbi:MAG: sulfatase [Anaerorhabdus sp.]
MYNFVYINTHDTGRMISPYGFDVPTPNLKELAKEGTLFTQAFCCSPTCSPSRAAMLTGVYPHQNGMLGLAQRGFSLINPEKHLASYLASHGYQTAISGIQHEVGWYLDLDEDAIKKLGYQSVLTTSSNMYEKEDLHLWDEANAIAASKWLESVDTTKPFMLSYGMHSTHRPYPIEVASNIDERYVKPEFPSVSNVGNRHDQAQYMTTAQYADRNVKRIVDALKEKGIYDNTILVFTTDHGAPLPFHKCNLKDDGMGISFILRHPKIGNGTVVDELVSQIDLFPTICDLLEIEKPDYLEGKSFAISLIDSNSKIHDEVFAEVNYHTSYEPIRCVRNKRYKYIRYFDETWKKLNLSNIDESEPKDFLMEHGLRDITKPMEALYDCYYDPNEVNNIIDRDDVQEVVKHLRKVLKENMEKTNDPLLHGELAFYPHYKVNTKTCLQASSKNPDDYDSRGRGL